MTAPATDEVDVGVCCMGIIEHAFAGISAIIGNSVVDRGWVLPQDLVHYTMHAELDIRHAEEFFAIVEPGWEEPRRRRAIEQGLELGAFAFDQLYRSLCG
jgi:pyrroloquinoline-quinone synthase